MNQVYRAMGISKQAFHRHLDRYLEMLEEQEQLKGRELENLADLRHQGLVWQEETANRRIHATTKESHVICSGRNNCFRLKPCRSIVWFPKRCEKSRQRALCIIGQPIFGQAGSGRENGSDRT